MTIHEKHSTEWIDLVIFVTLALVYSSYRWNRDKESYRWNRDKETKQEDDKTKILAQICLTPGALVLSVLSSCFLGLFLLPFDYLSNILFLLSYPQISSFSGSKPTIPSYEIIHNSFITQVIKKALLYQWQMLIEHQ